MTLWLDGSDGDFVGGDYFGIHAYGTTSLDFSYGAATKFSLANNGDASFEGSVTVKDGTTEFEISGDSSGNTYLASNGEIRVRPSGTTVNKLVIGSNGNITTAGTISAGNITTSNLLAGPATFTIDPAAVGDNTGTVVIAGNLQVDGTTTTINSTTLTVDDLNITLASGAANAAAANGAGITVDTAGASLTYDSTQDRWNMNKGLELIGSPLVVGTGTTDVGRVENSSGVFSLTAYTGRQIAFGNDTNGEHVRIDADGKVGIGTASPSAPLTIKSNSTSSGNSGLRIDANGSTDPIAVIGEKSTNGGRLHLYDAGVEKIAFYTDGTANHISAGNVGIGTSSPAYELDVRSSAADASIYVEDGASGAPIRLRSSGSGEAFIYIGNEASSIKRTGGDLNFCANAIDMTFSTNNGSTKHMFISTAGNVGIGTTTPAAKFQVEVAGIDTTTTSTTATTQVAIDTFAAATFRSARYTIQVTNSTDSTYHLTEVLLIHDGTTPQITEYGTIFTGSAEATFDADISSGNVRLLATPATTDSMTFKVVRHCITV